MKPFLYALLVALVHLQASGLAAAPASLAVQRLRCEYLENPLGLDEATPRLSWALASTERDVRQAAYRILVASDPALLARDAGDLWDTGRVASAETAHIVYRGKPLASGARAWWKVCVWDASGDHPVWSDAGWWEMGLLRPEDWGARWIARSKGTNPQPLPLLRRTFSLNGEIRRARAYVAGLGYHELYLNGRKVGDHLLDPGYTRYDKRVLYVTHDVTAHLRGGENAAGVMLGNGWYNVQAQAAWNFEFAPWRASPRLLLALVVDYADGRTERIVTDGNWKTAAGPITANTIYGGENYDARREQPGWSEPGFNDSKWDAALPVNPPAGRLVAQANPPIRITKTLTPVKVIEPRPGVFVFDAGQNLAGLAELRVAGPKGATLKLRYGERLATDGTVDQSDIAVHVLRRGPGQTFQTDSYTLRGGGPESWRARFVYHGFQYVEVTGSPVPLTAENLRVHFVHSDVPEAGRFTSSSEAVNRLWEAARWSYLSNLHGIPTDCPHREKNGWTGDAHLAAEQGLLTYDGAAVYEKWLRDLGDEQQPYGALPGIVPTAGWGYSWGNGPAWDSAYPLIAHYLHLYTGDTRALERHYEGHRRYVDFLVSQAVDGIVDIGLGDWAPWKTRTPEALTSTAYYYVDTRIVARTARLLGRTGEAARYEALAEATRRAFNARFYDPATGNYAGGGQTAQSCALYQGLAEESERPKVLARLLEAVKASDEHIDTGILGAKYLPNVLSENGHAALALRIILQDTIPGWGHWMKQGATTLWEKWDGSASRNHIMYGDISAWFTKVLAGINPDPAGPGFSRILLTPHPLPGLDFAEAEYESIRGRVRCGWRREGGRIVVRATVPANCTATLRIPEAAAARLSEGGRAVEKSVPGVRRVASDGGGVTLELGSGDYRFEIAR